MYLGIKMHAWILFFGACFALAFALVMIYVVTILALRKKNLDAAFVYMVYALARAAEAKEEGTGNHILRVGQFCALIAKTLGLPRQFVKDIRVQAVLHDVGKIHIPVDILIKPDSFTAEEWAMMKQHPDYGAMIVGSHQKLSMGRNIALTHHEKWDGSGYPHGLKGDEIPIEGQIIAVCDQYDALRSERSYKPAYSHKEAYRIITEGDGRTKPEHFSPRVLNAFKAASGEFEKVYEKMKDDSAAHT